MRNMKSHLMLLTAFALILAGCGSAERPPEATPSTQTTAATAEPSGGPRADSGRRIASPDSRLNEDGTSVITSVDFGNVEVDGYVAPARGTLIAPTITHGPVPLIVVNHLRAPNCSDGTYAWPCPEGTEEIRFDGGMEYLGENLAREGYATLIPDLTPLWVSEDVSDPYSQADLAYQIVGALHSPLGSDVQGASQFYGMDLEGVIDLESVGIIAHSRAALTVPSTIEIFYPDHVISVLEYGAEADLEGAFDPPASDIATLFVSGDEDGVVGNASNLWLAERIQEPRTTALVSMQVPGYGNMFINRELQSPEVDDREACAEAECPSAADHEALLAAVATDWFNATIFGAETEIPLDAHDPIPQQYAGMDVRWLVATHGRDVTAVPLTSFTAVDGHEAELCRHAANPGQPACPEPEEGTITTTSELLHLTGASADVEIENPLQLAVHVLPFSGSASQLTVTLHLASGKTHTVTFDTALASSNGEHLTIRTPLPLEVRYETIVGVELESGSQPVEVRGVEFLHAED